jgi:hypothetical protein
MALPVPLPRVHKDALLCPVAKEKGKQVARLENIPNGLRDGRSTFGEEDRTRAEGLPTNGRSD